MEEKDTKNYEFGFLLNGMLGDTEVIAVFDEIEKILSGFGAKILKKSEIERKALTYPIKKQKEAYFAFIHLEIDPEKINEVKNRFKYDANIVRYLCLTPAPNFGKVIEARPQYKEFHRGFKKEDKVVEVKEVKEEKVETEQVDLEGLDKKLGEIEQLS